jgi:hypothetical protein
MGVLLAGQRLTGRLKYRSTNLFVPVPLSTDYVFDKATEFRQLEHLLLLLHPRPG